MSSYSERSTELYDLIRPASNNCIPRPNKLDLQSCWKDMKFAKISPAIPTSLKGETLGTFKDKQVLTILLALILMKGALPFVVDVLPPKYTPVMCAVIYNSNTLTLSYPMFMLSNRYAYISGNGKRLLMLQNFPHLISCQHFWTLLSSTLLHFPT